MLRKALRRSYLNYVKRMLFILTALATLGGAVAAQCSRYSFHYGTTIYGGRQYDTFVSCGSSAGNFAYTCAEGGGCYENTSIDANAQCTCSNEMLTQ
jgi:hypothetical protein